MGLRQCLRISAMSLLLTVAVAAGVAGTAAPAVAATGSYHCNTYVHGAIEDKYWQLRGAFGPLGCPSGVEGQAAFGGRWQPFSAGYIFWRPEPHIWAKAVWGLIAVKWTEWGREVGPLGYPLTDETGTPDGVGRFNHFEQGSIYWSPRNGAHVVKGAIRDRWAALGWENSQLGYPTSDEYVIPGGWRTDFEYGSIEMVNGRIAVHSLRIVLKAPVITFDGGVPINGNTTLTLYSSGVWNYSGHFHLSGQGTYTVRNLWWVRAGDGSVAFRFPVEGTVWRYLFAADPDHDWAVSGTNPAIAAAWHDLEAGTNNRQSSAALDFAAMADQAAKAVGAAKTVITVLAAI